MSKDFVKFFTSVFCAVIIKYGSYFGIGIKEASCKVGSMEKKAISLAGILVVGFWGVVSCVDPAANVEPPLPSVSMAKQSGTPVETLGRGFSLYQTQCAQFHEHKMPKDMRVDEWHTIVPGMAWNAGLSKSDEKAVIAYLVAASRQINPDQKTIESAD